LHHDDTIGEDEMEKFQKQLSMPLNIFTPKGESHEEEADFDINDLKIDEEAEDYNSEDENSVSDSESLSKKRETLKTKKTIKVKKCSNKEK